MDKHSGRLFEPSADLSGGLMAMALVEPGLVESALEVQEGLSQLLDGVESADPGERGATVFVGSVVGDAPGVP